MNAIIIGLLAGIWYLLLLCVNRLGDILDVLKQSATTEGGSREAK